MKKLNLGRWPKNIAVASWLFLHAAWLVQLGGVVNVYANDKCNITAPNYSQTAYQHREVFEDLRRQVYYAKQMSLEQALVAQGMDPRLVDFLPREAIIAQAGAATPDFALIKKKAEENGYTRNQPLPDLPILTFAQENAKAKTQMTPAHASYFHDVGGVRIALDVDDYSGGTFKRHPHVDMDNHPRSSAYAKLPGDQMIAHALHEYRQANPAGIPLSTADNPVFYRVVSRLELEELLKSGQSRANGSVTDWRTDFCSPQELAWIRARNFKSENSLRQLAGHANFANNPGAFETFKAEFRAQFGRDLPQWFNTHAEIRQEFVDLLKAGWKQEVASKGKKDRLPEKTKELMRSFNGGGVFDEAAIGRYVEDNILSLPPGDKRNNAIIELFGYDYAAKLHADYRNGFDQFSPFKGTSIGLPLDPSDFSGERYLIAIRDIHGRARKNLGNGYEREWFFKDGIALDEVAGVWKTSELDSIPNGPIMSEQPVYKQGEGWAKHIDDEYRKTIVGDPVLILNHEAGKPRPKPPEYFKSSVANPQQSGIPLPLPANPQGGNPVPAEGLVNGLPFGASNGAGKLQDPALDYYSNLSTDEQYSQFVLINNAGSDQSRYVFHRGHIWNYGESSPAAQALSQALGFKKRTMLVSQLPEGIAKKIKPNAKKGDSVEVYQVPRVDQLNKALDKLPEAQSITARFVSVSGEISKDVFVDHLSNGKFIMDDVPTDMGRTGLHMHDMNGHALGYMAMPKGMVENLKDQAKFYKGMREKLSTLEDSSNPEISKKALPILTDVLASMEAKFVDKIDGGSMAIANKLGVGRDKVGNDKKAKEKANIKFGKEMGEDVLKKEFQMGTSSVYDLMIEDVVAKGASRGLNAAEIKQVQDYLAGLRKGQAPFRQIEAPDSAKLLEWGQGIAKTMP